MMKPPPRPAYRPFGKYQPIRKLATGVVGVTYLARGPNGEPVVLKALYTQIAQVPRRLVRFYQEAKLAMEIDHPNLVSTLEVGCQDGRHFIAMKLAPGRTLRAHVEQHGAMGEKESLLVIQQLGAAVEALHERGIIHRDINPDNALVDTHGHVTLVDLGLAKDEALPLNVTIDGGGLGDPQFIAPEQFRAAKLIGATADVYGLAATLSFLLTGRVPFAGVSPAEVLVAKLKSPYQLPQKSAAVVSQRTGKLVAQAMSRAPQQRPRSVAQMQQAIARCLQELALTRAKAPASAAAVRNHLCTVSSLSPTGQRVLRTLTEAQVARLIKSGELTATACLSSGSGGRWVPLAETPQFRLLFRRPPIWKRGWQRLLLTIGAARRETVRRGRGFWKLLQAELHP